MEKKMNKKFGIRDIMTIAAMMVLFFILTMIVSGVTLPIPVVYLYGSAGLDGFFGAIFYLVAANRVNKHGLLFGWATVFGIIHVVMGYAFMLPYFLLVGAIAEMSMIGKDTYRNPVRNMIGWGINCIGNVIGIAVPIWRAWDSYKEMALNGGFSVDTLNMQLEMVSNPSLMLLGVVVTAALSMLGILFGQKLLRKHFQKSGIVA